MRCFERVLAERSLALTAMLLAGNDRRSDRHEQTGSRCAGTRGGPATLAGTLASCQRSGEFSAAGSLQLICCIVVL